MTLLVLDGDVIGMGTQLCRCCDCRDCSGTGTAGTGTAGTGTVVPFW